MADGLEAGQNEGKLWCMFRITRDSALRKPPQPISERQIVLLDGIRYSADMAGVAIDRLWQQLCWMDSAEMVEPYQIAAAALDVWSIIDAAHRMLDLVENLPGLPNSNWRRIFHERVADALALRDVWQHQVGEAPAVVEQRGQAWGALAWAQHRDGHRRGIGFWRLLGVILREASGYMQALRTPYLVLEHDVFGSCIRGARSISVGWSATCLRLSIVLTGSRGRPVAPRRRGGEPATLQRLGWVDRDRSVGFSRPTP